MHSIDNYFFSQLLFNKTSLIVSFLCSVFFLSSCNSKNEKSDHSNVNLNDKSEQVLELSAEENYEAAKKLSIANPLDPDALIWYGRRVAYLGKYEEAIEIYTKGIDLHPDDARMYRHRGHRFISIREFDKAIADFEKAVVLIEGDKDEIEPDGLPNERNIPLSTLHGNIWYHLGLAHYLKNDMKSALKAYQHRTVTEKYDDNIVSGGHWLYMILSRMGNSAEADASIAKVRKEMDIIENHSYFKMCLFYKGLMDEEELSAKDPNSSSDNVLLYGLGNWYLYEKQDTVMAKKLYRQLLDHGNKYSFAYIAAESDWERLFHDEES